MVRVRGPRARTTGVSRVVVTMTAVIEPTAASPSASQPHGLVIAIDGPSGSGKSSVSKAVARSLSVGYLDTGAMYRALTWWVLEQGTDVADAEALGRVAADWPLEIGTDPDAPTVAVDGRRIDAEIRGEVVTSMVSTVSGAPRVREHLRAQQRRLMADSVQRTGGVVAEGRDITTVVAPDADVRVLLTASEEARLARRATELHGSADEGSVAATRAQIGDRDARDSAVTSFVEAAPGVTLVDTSDLDFDGSVAAVLAVVEAARPAGAGRG